MGCGDAGLLADSGDGSDILGRMVDMEPEAAVVDGCLLELAGAMPSLVDEERVAEVECSSEWLTF